MAGAQSSARAARSCVQLVLFETRACSKCGVEKAPHEYGRDRRECKACENARKREARRRPDYRPRARSAESRRRADEASARRRREKRATPEGLEAARAYKAERRKRLIAAGLTSNGTERRLPARSVDSRQSRDARRMDRLAEWNAVEAWRWWLKVKAPARWVRDYYRAMGKPWRNRRLTDGARWRIRYALDPDFRAREYLRLQRAKASRAALIESACDGTLTPSVVRDLFATATECPYCGERMRSSDKSLDHVRALSRGGAHSIANVVVCCLPCNVRKGARDPKSLKEKGSVKMPAGSRVPATATFR